MKMREEALQNAWRHALKANPHGNSQDIERAKAHAAAAQAWVAIAEALRPAVKDTTDTEGER